MLDEMSLKKYIEWDGKKFVGYVFSGDDEMDVNAPAATSVLVFMVVAVNGSFKVPVGYFPCVSMSGKEKANLVRICLEKLEDIDAKVESLVCDGPSAHFTMLADLGVSLEAENMKTHFSFGGREKIFCFLDVCHMLKCVRTNFKKVMVMYDKEGNRIAWEFIEKLAELQEKEGLR